MAKLLSSLHLCRLFLLKPFLDAKEIGVFIQRQRPIAIGGMNDRNKSVSANFVVENLRKHKRQRISQVSVHRPCSNQETRLTLIVLLVEPLGIPFVHNHPSFAFATLPSLFAGGNP